MDGGGARGLLGGGALGQRKGGQDAAEGRGVLVHQREQLVLDPLALLGPTGKFLPASVPAGLVRGKIGHHRAQRGTECTGVGRDRTASRDRALAGGLVGEGPQVQAHEPGLCRVTQEIFDHPLLRLERGQFVEPERADGNLDEFLFGHAHGALLLAQKITARVEQRLQRHQADELGARHAEAALAGGAADLVEGHVHGSHREVRKIDRHLGHAVFLDEPADGLHGLQRARDVERLTDGILHHLACGVLLRAARLAHVERHGIGAARGRGVEIDIVGDEQLPGPDDGGAAFRVKFGGTKVGLPLRPHDLLRESLVFAGANHGEILPGRIRLGVFVEIDRQPEFAPHPFAQAPRVLGRFRHGNASNGDQRADIRRAHAGVLAGVPGHVDDFAGLLDRPVSRFRDRRRRAHERHHRAVRRLAGVDVEQLDARHGLNLIGDQANHRRITAFAEIRYAFDYLAHGKKWG